MIIKFDLKCGFEELYVVEKGIEYDISIICSEEFYKPFLKELNIDESMLSLNIPSDEEVYATYGYDASSFLEDYRLLPMLGCMMKEAVAVTFLGSVCFKDLKNGKFEFDVTKIREPLMIPKDAQWYEPTICEFTNVRFKDYQEDIESTSLIC